MIKSFECKETEKIWHGLKSRAFPVDIQSRALRKLRQLDASQVLEDLKNPPVMCPYICRHLIASNCVVAQNL